LPGVYCRVIERRGGVDLLKRPAWATFSRVKTHLEQTITRGNQRSIVAKRERAKKNFAGLNEGKLYMKRNVDRGG